MLVVLLKKTDYNTKVAEIDTEISSLGGKITENKNNLKEAVLDIILASVGKSMFDGEDGFQVYSIFQPVYKYFRFITNTNYISSWKVSNDESIKPPTISDNSLTPLIAYYGYNITVTFDGSVLRQPKVTYTHKKVVNIYISY